MNLLSAKVADIRHHKNLTNVRLSYENHSLQLIALEIGDRVTIGTEVKLGVKATNITLAKNFEGLLSITNQLKGIVEGIENGSVLSSVKVRIGKALVECIMTLDASEKMRLSSGDDVTVLINASDLSLMEANAWTI